MQVGGFLGKERESFLACVYGMCKVCANNQGGSETLFVNIYMQLLVYMPIIRHISTHPCGRKLNGGGGGASWEGGAGSFISLNDTYI